MLVVRAGTEPEPFWNDAAETSSPRSPPMSVPTSRRRSYARLWGMRSLIASRENYAHALAEMQKNEDFDGVLQQLGGQLSWYVDKQLGSVMSMAQRHTNIFDSPLITDATGGTDWNPAELRSGKMTVYLIVPADRLVVWAGWMRLVLGSILRIITRGRPTEKNPVLFLVDEAAHIGRMQALEDGITLMRGMGIRIFLFSSRSISSTSASAITPRPCWTIWRRNCISASIHIRPPKQSPSGSASSRSAT